ncbi:hypothetical protein [Marinicella sp. W31]|uniref:hypothetical protein n=1 Tax=Marinicella sp. W31 TaxID=3023713 RepID=UPI00375712D9
MIKALQKQVSNKDIKRSQFSPDKAKEGYLQKAGWQAIASQRLDPNKDILRSRLSRE